MSATAAKPEAPELSPDALALLKCSLGSLFLRAAIELDVSCRGAEMNVVQARTMIALRLRTVAKDITGFTATLAPCVTDEEQLTLLGGRT